LAVLYDRFANALDPFAPERDQAEMIFEQEVVTLSRPSANAQAGLGHFQKGGHHPLPTPSSRHEQTASDVGSFYSPGGCG